MPSMGNVNDCDNPTSAFTVRSAFHEGSTIGDIQLPATGSSMGFLLQSGLVTGRRSSGAIGPTALVLVYAPRLGVAIVSQSKSSRALYRLTFPLLEPLSVSHVPFDRLHPDRTRRDLQ